ncbi:acyl-CoA dehydrogenase [Plantactinospora sp. B6F1]|uniref:acyl-CoA dehydrogenase n=1 Tax=Plantactinospora sp. B6F1 TaxID=3158971 RepID=UPI0032D98BE7
MRLLAADRAVLDRLLPGLDAELGRHPLTALERPESPGLAAFRLARGPGLLVPVEHGGTGATAREAVRCTRAIGSRSPSLAVAATMHNFSVASLVALSSRSEGFEWMLLDAVARDRLLVASAFAEGRTAQGILSPTMRAERDGKRWLVTGSKKPCSLSRSADIFTTSVLLHEDAEAPRLGVALITAHSPGITVRPFWASGVLTGAESDELVLTEVPVEDELMVRMAVDPDAPPDDDLQTVGLIWFSLLITAAYLGAAAGLVERLTATRGTPELRAQIVTDLVGAALAVDRVAADVDAGDTGQDVLADALVARYAAQGAIGRAVSQTVELLGGIAFVSGPDVAYLAAACQALAFHPPSRGSVGRSLDGYFAGGTLTVD